VQEYKSIRMVGFVAPPRKVNMKKILDALDYILFGAMMLYFFCGGFKLTIDYLIGVQ